MMKPSINIEKNDTFEFNITCVDKLEVEYSLLLLERR